MPGIRDTNEMTAEQFNMLSANVDEVGFLDPILVVPLPVKSGKVQQYRIVDGEHRFELMRLNDAKEIPCVIVDPKRFDERKQKQQTVRMNKIHGTFNVKKFSALVADMMGKYKISHEEMAQELGFVNPKEFDEMVEAVRETLPTKEMKKEFDQAKGDLKSIDDLGTLINDLFSHYGSTLPANFMIIDFGGKEHLWVRLPEGAKDVVTNKAKECAALGVTFDSLLVKVITDLNFTKYIEKNRGFLDSVEDQLDV